MHVLSGKLMVGSMFVVINYLGAVYGPLSAIAHTTGQLQGAVAGARRVREMLALTPETVEAPGAIAATNVQGEVRFDHVGFSYPDGANVLHDINFTAQPGQMIAVVGLTGAGKTTLVSLIPRFYDATAGRVLIDSVDVRRYDPIAAGTDRDRASDPCCFRHDCGEPSVRASGRDDGGHRRRGASGHADEFVSRLPKKYETPIAEAGAGLSGGKSQRLSVARAILKNAPILILDEPTSSLDAISEEIVFEALRKLRVGRTTIVIAHRLSTVRDADAILVLDGGRISARDATTNS
jgi:ABC-type multidrug transport system fused ATPase/permease subunit